MEEINDVIVVKLNRTVAAFLRQSNTIAKAMMNFRDAEAFRSKCIELQGVALEALERAIAAREAQTAQTDRIRALEAEVAHLKSWNAERENYELKKCGEGSIAYMLKPEKRGSEPPHWLCPNCFATGQKSFLISTGKNEGRAWSYKCFACGAMPSCWPTPQWDRSD